MASKNATSNAFQRRCAKVAEKAGWSVYNQAPTTRMIMIRGRRIWIPQHKDIFGCDFLAVKEDNKVLMVQVSMDAHVEKRAAEFAKYNFCPATASVQLWIKRSPARIACLLWDPITKEFTECAQIYRGKWEATPKFPLGEPWLATPSRSTPRKPKGPAAGQSG